MHDPNLTSYEGQAISLCTLLARRFILQQWKSDAGPLFHQWLRELGNILHMERLRYTITNKDKHFRNTWQPLLDKWAAASEKKQAQWATSSTWVHNLSLLFSKLVLCKMLSVKIQSTPICWPLFISSFFCFIIKCIYIFFIMFSFIYLFLFSWGWWADGGRMGGWGLLAFVVYVVTKSQKIWRIPL